MKGFGMDNLERSRNWWFFVAMLLTNMGMGAAMVYYWLEPVLQLYAYVVIATWISLLVLTRMRKQELKLFIRAMAIGLPTGIILCLLWRSL